MADAGNRMKRGPVILEGVVGSTAYGLDIPGQSDIDTLGVYLAPLADVISIHWNQQRQTTTSTAPDVTRHELGKFLALVVKGNPTVTELLWLDSYTVETVEGAALRRIRRRLLGSNPLRKAYVGYAASQAKRLLDRSDEGRAGFSSDLQHRTRKHGRHLWRLMLQAEHALTTGEIQVHVGHRAEEIFEMGALAESNPRALVERFEVKADTLRSIQPPDSMLFMPDMEAANRLLLTTRVNGWLRSI